MKIPIMIESIIQKSTKCFKYLLINGNADPNETIQDQNPVHFLDSNSNTIVEKKRYEWDCMAIPIYYGEMEIMTILKEFGFQKGNKSCHLEAAIWSYRNFIAKELITKFNDKEKMMIGLIASAKSNNIKAGHLINNNNNEVNMTTEKRSN